MLFLALAVGCDDAAPSPSTAQPSLRSERRTAAVAEASRDDAPSATEPASKASGPDAGNNDDAGDRLLDKTFDDIKFDIEPDAPFDRAMLTEPIEQLDGKRIRIRGWILPTARTRGIKQFVLVRDDQECCFGPGAALYDCILVEMRPGKTTQFSTSSVAVEGEFSIEEFPGPDGRPLAIYRLQGESVEL